MTRVATGQASPSSDTVCTTDTPMDLERKLSFFLQFYYIQTAISKVYLSLSPRFVLFVVSGILNFPAFYWDIAGHTWLVKVMQFYVVYTA